MPRACSHFHLILLGIACLLATGCGTLVSDEVVFEQRHRVPPPEEFAANVEGTWRVTIHRQDADDTVEQVLIRRQDNRWITNFSDPEDSPAAVTDAGGLPNGSGRGRGRR